MAMEEADGVWLRGYCDADGEGCKLPAGSVRARMRIESWRMTEYDDVVAFIQKVMMMLGMGMKPILSDLQIVETTTNQMEKRGEKYVPKLGRDGVQLKWKGWAVDFAVEKKNMEKVCNTLVSQGLTTRGTVKGGQRELAVLGRKEDLGVEIFKMRNGKHVLDARKMKVKGFPWTRMNAMERPKGEGKEEKGDGGEAQAPKMAKYTPKKADAVRWPLHKIGGGGG